MKEKFKFNRIAWIGIIALAALVILLPNKAQLQNNQLEITDLEPLKDRQKEGSPKMEYVLYSLMKKCLTEGIEQAKEFASQRAIDMEGDLVRVVIEAKPVEGANSVDFAVSFISKQVEALGGKVETTYRHLVQSITPIPSLQDLVILPSVRYIRLPLKPFTCIVSEGVAATGANQWQNINAYRSTKDAKVCIFDAGFDGYPALLGNELPSSVTAMSFRADGDIYAHEHGTACAEIVHDMAPKAKLWLVNYGTDVEHHNAVNWIINQNVDVISYSMGWTNAGAGDGTGPICEDVKKANNAGIPWVSAAGNEAEDHWEGTWNDPDGDWWHNFSGVDEILQFYVPAYTPVTAFLNWDDWGSWSGTSYSGSDQDFDLYLWWWNGWTWVFVDVSMNWQTGTQWPTEAIGGWWSNISTFWGISIGRWSSYKNVKFELFTRGNSMAVEYNKPEGSLSIPADSQYAIAVGAVGTNDVYHDYSSRGPTSDFRTKPDICAPSGVSTSTYGIASIPGALAFPPQEPAGFFGTSASTPHVAGAIALVYALVPYSANEVVKIIYDRVKDLGPSGKDNKFGYGRLKLTK